MTTQRRRSDAHHAAARLRAADTPHVASHVSSDVLVRVVKIGGRAQGDPRLAATIRDAANASSARIVIVHGGGDEVTALQRRMGVEPAFIGGRRVTNPEDLDAVRMVLSGSVNKRLVAGLLSKGVRAVGLSGEDAGLLSARVTDAELGRVGGDVFADATIVADLLNAQWVPVISPIARDRESPTGAGLNVNGDDAAAAIAAGLGADELVFIADVPGVLDGDSTLASLDATAISELEQRGVVKGGMRAKLEAALAALKNGVHRVRITSIAGIIDPAVGTVITDSTTSKRDHE